MFTLLQGYDFPRRIIYNINQEHNLSKYYNNFLVSIYSLSECPSCRYTLALRDMGKNVNDNINIRLELSTNNFTFERMDPRVDSKEFKKFFETGSISLNIESPIKSGESIHIGHLSMSSKDIINTSTCYIKESTRGCIILKYKATLNLLPSEVQGVKVDGKIIPFPPISDHVEVFKLDGNKTKFVSTNPSIRH